MKPIYDFSNYYKHNYPAVYQQRQRITMNHNFWKIALIVLTIICFIVVITFNGLAANNRELFKTRTGDVANKFPTEVTPSGWTFGIWGFIYAWQGIWLVYSVTCIFRRTDSGGYLYQTPPFLDSLIFAFFIVNLCANLSWIFLWGHEHLGWALLFLCILTLALYALLFMSHRKLNENIYALEQEGCPREKWFVRLFIQNGVAFYATWVSIASILNFVIYITWRLSANKTDSSTAGLCLILVSAVAYSIVENLVWPRFLLYTFSPWIVIVVALSGVLTKNWQENNPTRNNILALVILLVAVVLAVIKIIAFILYKTVFKKRIYYVQ